MAHILLTGAGFSRNWGGWLANEVFGHILDAPDIDEQLRSRLWQSRLCSEGFEDTLAAIQLEHQTSRSTESERQLRAMNNALIGMFKLMNEPLKKQWRQDDVRMQAIAFLSRFDAIFTLNQDTLLESDYLRHVRQGSKWARSYLPYMESINAAPQVSTHQFDAEMTPAKDFNPDPNRQPYYKLHGSSNWRAGGELLLVMGGNKSANIGGFEILREYYREFCVRLAKPNTRLMVIGYSFGDAHINYAICKAAGAGQLRIFIIDPQGIDVLRKQNPRAPLRYEPLVEQLKASVIGASLRPLRSTLVGDEVERNKVMNFFGEPS
jgi:hypothetical protein